MNWMHFHDWQTIHHKARGVFRKQDGQADGARYFRGRVEKCRDCQKMRLVPFNTKLRPVEVEN